MTNRMTIMGKLGTHSLLLGETSEERNGMLEELQESDRLQWIMDQEDSFCRQWNQEG